MGGMSMNGGMLFSRGSPRDFDYWGELGNVGWDYKSVLPYYKKMETFEDFATQPGSCK